MHGGAPGSGAPIGNKNAFRHGGYTAEAITWRRGLAELMGLFLGFSRAPTPPSPFRNSAQASRRWMPAIDSAFLIGTFYSTPASVGMPARRRIK
jgi:hypothetical protein